MKKQIQSSGRALSAMVMPNIGAFIAWGLITCLFIPSGWLPNERLARLVDPMLYYMLPLLIAYTGGRNAARNDRGGVIGAIATMGVIVGGDIPMFIGAMMMGPFAGWIIRKFEGAVAGRVKAGFEMLVRNFSVGIIGLVLALIGYYFVGWFVSQLSAVLSVGVEWIMQRGLLPLVSVIIEPAKVLFLNNAINHGILSPIGIEQSREMGSSILFLLETNPGPGLGVLLAYSLFGRGSARQSAPGAAVIQFLGGIHEIYFPYILARPLLIVAPIVGSAAGILFMNLLGGGLVAPASPGSIISVLAMAPKGKMVVVLGGVVISTAVSFLISMPLVRKGAEDEEPADSYKKPDMGHRKEAGTINRVTFACDAGMGSSAMGATRFSKRVGTGAEVGYSAVDEIPAESDVVVCQKFLAERARRSAPQSEIVVIANFLDDPALDELAARIAAKGEAAAVEPVAPAEKAAEGILKMENIVTGLTPKSRDEAVLRVGRLLERSSYAAAGYAEAMLDRENASPTTMGMGLAIPHGTAAAKDKVVHPGIAVLQYPEGVDWGNGETVRLVIGIAGAGDAHIEILARLAGVLEDSDLLERLCTTTDKELILKTLDK
jgi:PTS system mannitol-specific IIC component